MAQMQAIKKETDFEREVKRRKKENYDLLVAKSTYEKNRLQLKSIKWMLILATITLLKQLFT